MSNSEIAASPTIPGVFRCAKCAFTLVQATLNAHNGSVTARDAPGEQCPNDGSPMWRVTYAEQLEEAHEEWGKQVERAAEAERKLEAIRATLEPVMHWYDGEPADGDEHEPRELVDILTDVVADLQSDRDSALRMNAALRPFAACMEYIKPDESDEEWAKFRLLIKHYRAAHDAINTDGRPITESGKP